MLFLAVHGISWRALGGILLLLCCTPMVLQALWPSSEYEINLGATLQCEQTHNIQSSQARASSCVPCPSLIPLYLYRQQANGTLQDSIVDPRRDAEADAAVPRDANGGVQADALLGAVVTSMYSPPTLVVDGVTVHTAASRTGGDTALVERAAPPRLGVVVPSEDRAPPTDSIVSGELLTAYQPEPVERLGENGGADLADANSDAARDGLVESL